MSPRVAVEDEFTRLKDRVRAYRLLAEHIADEAIPGTPMFDCIHQAGMDLETWMERFEAVMDEDEVTA